MTLNQARRLLGNRRDHIESLRVAAGMLLVASAYAYLSRLVAPDYQFNTLEFLGTWTGLVCVWLTRTQNVLCWPWGIASAMWLGAFFGQIGLPGQQWLNWAYFVPISLWSWPQWTFGGAGHEELPVTTLRWEDRAVTLVVLAAGSYVALRLIGLINPVSQYPLLDAVVVAASVVAQYLLGIKKTESWLLWLGPVNLASIALFAMSGAYVLTALYAAFLIHAAFALRDWARAGNPYADVHARAGDREVLSAASGS